MNIVLFYILRKFFVNLTFTADKIILEKKIIVKKNAVLYRKDIIRTQVRKTFFMRIIAAKEVTLFTRGGKMRFFLSENEDADFLPKHGKIPLRPTFPETLFGAFIDTRALTGVLFFALTLRKIGVIFGGNYLDKVIRVLFTTAESVSEALPIIHIVVPKTAIFIGIFALSAWTFAFMRKLFALFGFETSVLKNSIYVKSGFITLYENQLALNSAETVVRTTAFSLITKRSPLYYNSVMIYPCANEKARSKLLKTLIKLDIPDQPPVKSPDRAFFGHCAVPLWCLAGFSAALIVLLLSELRSALIIRTALISGIMIFAYLTILFFFYMKSAKNIFSDSVVKISSRRAAALYTAFFPPCLIVCSTVSQNVLQKFSGICSVKINIFGRKNYTARLIPESSLTGQSFLR